MKYVSTVLTLYAALFCHIYHFVRVLRYLAPLLKVDTYCVRGDGEVFRQVLGIAAISDVIYVYPARGSR